MPKPKERWPLRQIVEVEWVDSATAGGWKTLDDHGPYLQPLKCRSVGFLAARTPRSIVLLQSQSSEGKMTDVITIPSGCVKSVRSLGRTGKRR